METLAFDEAIAVAKAFYDQHPNETIIVVTADHETGGLALGNGGMQYESNLTALANQHISSEGFDMKLAEFSKQLSGDKGKDFADMLVLIGQEFGLGDSTKISLTSSELTQLQHVFNQNMYIGPGEKPDASGSSYERITSFLIKLMSNKAGLGWTSYSHTGINVPVYAIGPGSEMFNGMIDNTDIPKNLEKLLMIQE